MILYKIKVNSKVVVKALCGKEERKMRGKKNNKKSMNDGGEGEVNGKVNWGDWWIRRQREENEGKANHKTLMIKSVE